MANSRILELSSSIARNTTIVEDFCKRNDIQSPSLDVNAPPTIFIPDTEPEAAEAQTNIIAAARELAMLMRGPSRTLQEIGYVDAFALHTILRFRIAKSVPVGGEISFEEISRLCGIEVSVLRRILRFAMTNGYFCDTGAGLVSHTSQSRVLAESTVAHHGFAYMLEECFTAAAKATDALEQYPGSEEPTETVRNPIFCSSYVYADISKGWGLSFHAHQPMFAELHDKYPARHRNAAIAMDEWNSKIPPSPLVDNFPWNTIDTVVDIGGGHGLVSLSIAKEHPRPKFVVQDLPSVVADGPFYIPVEHQERITFLAHDMFQEQPVKHADVYFFRSVFHDWPDKYCVQILKALVPAMKPGARVVLNDACIPPQGTLAPAAEREKRMWDLHMMMIFNARDREDADWAQLFQKADTRFKFLGTRIPDVNVEGIPRTYLLSIIEAVWEQ